MSFRFNFGRHSPVTSLLTDASILRRSLSASTDLLERDSNVEIIARSERILCDDLARQPGTIALNGTSLAKIFLSLAYSKATWSEFDVFFKIALLA